MVGKRLEGVFGWGVGTALELGQQHPEVVQYQLELLRCLCDRVGAIYSALTNQDTKHLSPLPDDIGEQWIGDMIAFSEEGGRLGGIPLPLVGNVGNAGAVLAPYIGDEEGESMSLSEIAEITGGDDGFLIRVGD